MTARSKARKRAVDILYEADLRGIDPRTTLQAWVDRDDPPVSDYTRLVVLGVAEHREQIDNGLSRHSRDWSLERMPAVDRAVLRLAAYELLYGDDVPAAVVIDEAVELVKSLSTDDSPGFVNGLLGQLLAERSETA